MKVKKSVVFAAALACGILLAVPLGAAAASNYRMAENGPATREESARLNRTFLYLNIEYNDRAPHEQLSLDTAGDSVVSWRSADPSIVTVSPDGVVTACAEGITNVYADTASGTTLSCAVTVTNNIGRVSLSESRLYLEDMGGTYRQRGRGKPGGSAHHMAQQQPGGGIGGCEWHGDGCGRRRSHHYGVHSGRPERHLQGVHRRCGCAEAAERRCIPQSFSVSDEKTRQRVEKQKKGLCAGRAGAFSMPGIDSGCRRFAAY